MLSIQLIRERPDYVKDVLKKRFMEDLIPVVDQILELDREWRELLKELNTLRAERNRVSKRIGALVREGRSAEAEELKKKASELARKISEMEKKEKELREEIKKLLMLLPNVIHPDIPIGPDDSYNRPVRFWGKPKVWEGHLDSFKEQTVGFDVPYELVKEKPYHHYDLVEMLDVVDTERAAKVAGSRFYYEKNELVFLDLALSMYALNKLVKKGFTPLIPPYMVRRFVEEGSTYFTDFEDTIYKIEGEDLYLIPTAEHAIAGYHAGEIFEVGELPRRYVGWSPCFRKEAGSHGKDTKGIFRVHQFHKVEQFSYVYPEDSWKEHEFLIQNAEEILQELQIPYRVVDIASGDLGAVAARKFDIEGWFPGQGKYRELVSGSNCLDWQARRLNIRYRKKDGSTDFVHTLNATALAVQRVITAILENHFDGEVVKIPRVLWDYLPREMREIPLRRKKDAQS
ncbi:MAG: serine--tRNA ligase [Candidatus Diapherotrites archaeon]|nr:serine--tRNA ligase [Candidatus Diapherotrites archaeon]